MKEVLLRNLIVCLWGSYDEHRRCEGHKIQVVVRSKLRIRPSDLLRQVRGVGILRQLTHDLFDDG